MPFSKPSEIRKGSYLIHQSATEPIPLEVHPWRFNISNAIAYGLGFLYIVYQFNFARSVQHATPYFMWQMWLALFGEIFVSSQDVVLALGTTFALLGQETARIRPRYRLMGSSAPTVDVCVCCCGEPVEVVVNTVAAVLAQDYPPDRFRVFILDDARDQQLQAAVELLNRTQAVNSRPQAVYLSRKKTPGVKTYFKAGNLQFGIDESKRSGGSELFSSLDADMIVDSDWLRALVPHLILDDKMGMACPPQRYYNVPPDDFLSQQWEFHFWFTIYEPLNDRINAAMCTGSGFVVRRAALEHIGGWPQVDAGEDFMCSSLLTNAGWKMAFIREYVQRGLAPGSFRSHIKQRMRWADCSLEVHKKFKFYLPGQEFTSHLPWTQRGVGTLMLLRDYAYVLYVVGLVLLPMVMWPTKSDTLATLPSEHNRFWLRMIFLAAYLARKTNNYIVYSHIGLQGLARLESMDVWISPYHAYSCIRALLPSTILSFEATGSVVSPENERSRLHRKPLPYRLLSPYMGMYIIYVICASTALLLRISTYRTTLINNNPLLTTNNNHDHPFFPFPGAAIKLVECIWKVAIPVQYMIFPPTVPEWSELVDKSDEQGVRRPKKRAEEENISNSVTWTDALDMLMIYLC